ncbi:MAG: antibiotic biosynthesis monooxygenase [Nitrospinae bacterium]|nr:antibiotic biosynthesis monooxygenase [Nitrospinota bacterium]
MLVSMVNLKVKKDKVSIVDRAFAGRKNMLDNEPGFKSIRLIKSSENEQDFVILSMWESLEDLMKWKNRPKDPNKKKHGHGSGGHGGGHGGGGNGEENYSLLEGKPQVVRYEVLSESCVS